MIIGCGFICVFTVLMNKVSLQVTVHKEAVIGGSVVLPCSSTEHDLELQEIDVLWRHNDSEIVYDLIKGQISVAGQNPRYRNRAKTFQDECLRGNFSIKLINLQYTDAGAFSCIITHSDETQTVQLIINESTAEKRKNATEHGNQGPETTSDLNILFGVGTPLLLLFAVIACYIIYKVKKKAHYREQSQSES